MVEGFKVKGLGSWVMGFGLCFWGLGFWAQKI